MNKSMEVSQKQILRGRVLNLCGAAEPIGAGSEVVAGMLVKEGYYKGVDAAKKEVEEIYTYLSGKGLIDVNVVDNKVLEISRLIAKITPLGTDALDGTVTVDGIILA